MAYEQSKFGDGSAAGSGNVVATVSNHYGPFTGNGEKGVYEGDGAVYEAVVDFDGTGPLFVKNVIPAGAVVTEVLGIGLTGAIATALVGALDISAADGAVLNYVTVVTAGELTVTGPTAGKVLVRYLKVG